MSVALKSIFSRENLKSLGKKVVELFIWLVCITGVYSLSHFLIEFSNYWNIWNFISIASVGFFSLVVHFLFKLGRKEERKDLLIESGWRKVISEWGLYFIPFVVAGGISVHVYSIRNQQGFENEIGLKFMVGMIIILVFYTIGDSFLWHYFRKNASQTRKKMEELEDKDSDKYEELESQRKKFSEIKSQHKINSLILDVPFLLSFIFLLFYFENNRTLPNIDVFLGGASAFQVLAQNTAFIISTRIL